MEIIAGNMKLLNHVLYKRLLVLNRKRFVDAPSCCAVRLTLRKKTFSHVAAGLCQPCDGLVIFGMYHTPRLTRSCYA